MTVETIAFYNRPFPAGGAETVTRNLTRIFHERGMRVIVYCSLFEPAQLNESELETYEIRTLPDPTQERTPENIDFLRRSLTDEQVDVLIVQVMSEFPFAEIRESVPTRLIFCLHGVPLWEMASIRRLKLSQCHPNATLIRKLKFLLFHRPVNRYTNRPVRHRIRHYASILPHIDRFVSLCPQYTEQMTALLRKYGYMTDALREKFTDIPNPLPPPRKPVAVPKEKTVLYAGRFERTHKRIDRLLRIWQRVEPKNPEWRLVLAGDGPDRANLEQMARRLGLQRVEFVGYQHDMAPYYRRAAFVCLTSNFEGTPMCLTEGAQYGAIPVSFDSYASIREVSCEGEAGIMVPAYDMRKYAERLDAAMKDESLQERMRAACYRNSRRYAPETIERRWMQLFDRME